MRSYNSIMPCHRSNSAISLCYVLAFASLFFTSLLRLPVADGSVPPLPSFIRGVRGGGIVTAAASATTDSSSSSTRVSSDIVGNELCMENEHVAPFPATDANNHTDTSYNDSDPVNVEENEDAAIASTATSNTEPVITPPKTIQYVIKKDGTVKPFEKDKVRKAKGE